jgi:lysozyme
MISAAIALCVSSVISHEGFRHKQYRDTNGWSIGNGYSLTQNSLHLDKKTIANFKRYGISELRSHQLVAKVCSQNKQLLESKYEWFNNLSDARMMVLLDMSYNLGSVDEFDKTLKYIRSGRTTMASVEMLNSRWARQVRSRAKELSQIMKTGLV